MSTVMTRASRIILGTALVLFVALFAALSIGSRRQQSALAAQIARLIRAGTAHAAPAIGPHPLDAIPAPVARYLRLAVPKLEHIHEVRISQTGELRTDAKSERWMRFEAQHIVVPPAPGFVWSARVSVAPLLHVRVRDALVEGRGSGQVTLLSAFTVGADADTPQMNSGSLHRYLAEAVWYPTALLPGPTLRWTAINGTRALATMTDRGVSVTLEFQFADTGEVIGIYTPARWGKFAAGYRQVPWEGHFRHYQDRDGIFVPTYGEVGWYVDGSWGAVWKGTITSFRLRTRY